MTTKKDSWFVYILRCADETLYTGIAKDVEKRLQQHNTDDKAGAKYTRSRRPVALLYSESYGSRSEASRREYQVKRMTRKEKLILIGEACES